MKPLIILGAVGTCLDIAEAALAGDQYAVLGFLDDSLPIDHVTTLGLPVLGRTADTQRFPNALFINGIGSPASYLSKPGFINSLGLHIDQFATVIHPASVVSASAKLEPGCAVLAHCSIGSGVHINEHVVMLQNCVIGHDSSIGQHTIFAAGVTVSGHVSIGKNCYIGAGVSIRNNIQIGNNALLGLGSSVVTDIPAGETWYGNPAKCSALP
jgi:sugar O-acyltransferase (sialic acid O-acetyltransferase NeuD family)